MKSLVIYDSYFGNTQKVAEAVAKMLGTKAVKFDSVSMDELNGLELLVVGCPTRAFSATPELKNFLKNIPDEKLKTVKFATFDTRMNVELAPKILKFLAGIFGYAAEPMAKILTKKGATQAIEPVGFFVKDSEGPLADGELKRAEEWVKRLNNRYCYQRFL